MAGGNPDQAELERLLMQELGDLDDGQEPEVEEVKDDRPEEISEGELEAQQAEKEVEESKEQAEDADEDAEKPVEFAPPEDWDDDAKAWLEEFESVDDRKRVVDMVGRQVRTAREMAEKRYEEASHGLRVLEAIKPYQQQGVDPAQAVQNLLTWEQSYLRDPLGTINVMIDQGMRSESGRSLAGSEQARNFVRQVANALGVQSLEEPSEDWLDPAAGQAFKTLNSKLAEIDRRLQAQQVPPQPSEAQARIAEFARTHDHFEEARPVMAALIQAGRATDLDDSYQMALKAIGKAPVENPRPRGKLVRKSTAAPSAPTNGLGGQREDWSQRSIEEHLLENWRRAQAGQSLV